MAKISAEQLAILRARPTRTERLFDGLDDTRPDVESRQPLLATLHISPMNAPP
ncbi:hypothetical protein [Micromonospora sp. NPDC005174]|uniref:hypothetical protein n=1 Tax=Micromonospora sp. NPDC005174 TaxID=3157018 RepID=UPI0033A3FA22